MKKLVAVLFVALAFSLFGCKGPEGPVGPAGAAGKDGQNAGFVYFDGFKDSLKCSMCHTPGIDTTFFVQGRVTEWNNSKHNIGGDIDRNAANCAGCHTTEGFLDRSKMNFTTQFAWSEKLHPSPPGCFACHAPHGRGDFKLRDSSAVTLTNVFVGGANVIFNGGGKSNLCVQCHQPRNTSSVSPAPNINAAATDTTTITSPRWYQHYGVQAQMFLGTGGNGGFQFPGYSYSNSGHTSLVQAKTLGCVDCHMQEPVGGGAAKAGGHTMWLKYEAEGNETFIVKDCKVCHSDITATPTTYTLSATAFNAYKSNARNNIAAQLDTLANLLMDTTKTKTWNAGSRVDLEPTRTTYGKTLPWLTKSVDAEGEVSYSVPAGDGKKSTSTNLYAYPPIKAKGVRAGALWNFMFIEHDRSEGVHNYQYAKALLSASIAELNKP